MAQDWKEILAALGTSGDIPRAPEENEAAAPASEEKVQKAPLKIFIDRKARHGKAATVIEGFLCTDERLKEISRTLKQTLGCGGSAREGEMLLQGDVRQKAAAELNRLGFKTKMC